MNWLICPDRSPARKSRGLLKGEKEISNENEADDMSPKKKNNFNQTLSNGACI